MKLRFLYAAVMLIDLPDHKTLYEALLARDESYDGRVYVCVTSTGVFCRLTCPARNPKPENCEFFGTVAECLEAGFRPCQRCRPLSPSADSDPSITRLLAALRERPAYRWSESDIAALGLDPSTVRRAFKRQFGMTFLELARLTRIRNGFQTLSDGGRVIDAQIDAGFDSPAAFRSAMARILGRPPASFAKDGLLKLDWIDTPLGAMIVVADRHALHLLEFVDRKALPRELKTIEAGTRHTMGFGRTQVSDRIEQELDAFFGGTSAQFSVPLALHGSAFARSVWNRLRDIPPGTTRSYSEIAREIGRPSATRAVARANGANPIAIVVPCHRVIAADGNLTGYGGGLWRKQKLIDIEKQFLVPRQPA